MDKNKLIEVLKEPVRWLVLAGISYLILTVIPGLDLDPDTITKLTAALRLLDKIIHDYGKATESEEIKKGITRF